MHVGIELLRVEMGELTVTSGTHHLGSSTLKTRGLTIGERADDRVWAVHRERGSDGGGNPGVVKVVLEALTARPEILQ